MKIDINNKEELVKVVKDYEVVVNTVGLFYKYGYVVASSLVEAGVKFVDICDDYDAAESIVGLAEKAEERGILGIIWVRMDSWTLKPPCKKKVCGNRRRS